MIGCFEPGSFYHSLDEKIQFAHLTAHSSNTYIFGFALAENTGNRFLLMSEGRIFPYEMRILDILAETRIKI